MVKVKGCRNKWQPFFVIINERKTVIISIWEINDNKITKNYELQNFVNALALVNLIGEVSEELKHHPDILIHGYRHEGIQLFTHSSGKITNPDYELAELIDRLYYETPMFLHTQTQK